jgi:hypothetical protein
MIDAISKLVESGAISEDVQKSIQEAWDQKIKENKEVVGAEHDRSYRQNDVRKII